MDIKKILLISFPNDDKSRKNQNHHDFAHLRTFKKKRLEI